MTSLISSRISAKWGGPAGSSLAVIAGELPLAGGAAALSVVIVCSATQGGLVVEQPAGAVLGATGDPDVLAVAGVLGKFAGVSVAVVVGLPEPPGAAAVELPGRTGGSGAGGNDRWRGLAVMSGQRSSYEVIEYVAVCPV